MTGRLAIKDELMAMKLRGRLVAPVVSRKATGKRQGGEATAHHGL